jgi:hypothetical protein
MGLSRYQHAQQLGVWGQNFNGCMTTERGFDIDLGSADVHRPISFDQSFTWDTTTSLTSPFLSMSIGYVDEDVGTAQTGRENVLSASDSDTHRVEIQSSSNHGPEGLYRHSSYADKVYHSIN